MINLKTRTYRHYTMNLSSPIQYIKSHSEQLRTIKNHQTLGPFVPCFNPKDPKVLPDARLRFALDQELRCRTGSGLAAGPLMGLQPKISKN